MGRYKDLTLTVGVFFRDGTENTSQVQFKGWLLANGEEVTFFSLIYLPCSMCSESTA